MCKKCKNGQYITNNNYYVRMYIDTKKETPIHLYGSLLILPLISTYMIQDIWEYILLYVAFKGSF